MLLDAPVVVAARHRGVPHAHLADQPAQQAADGLLVLVHGQPDRLVELVVGQARRPVCTISPVSQTWWSTIFSSSSMPLTLSLEGSRMLPGGTKCTTPGSPIWMWPGRPAPVARRGAVRLGERAREGLVRGVARLDRDVEQRCLRRDHAVRRALEQDAPPQRLRRLAADRLDHPVEVEPGEVLPGRPVGTLAPAASWSSSAAASPSTKSAKVSVGDGHGPMVSHVGVP